MPRRAHQRLRLPADDRSPATARDAVRQVLLAAGWADRLDEALLLVSELATNSVVHAGTAVELDVVTDEHGVTVTVSDQQAGLVGMPWREHARDAERTGPEEIDLLEERGRGLLLVDRLATTWGTSHHGAGKSVWFRLGTAPGPGYAGADPDGTEVGAAAAVAAALTGPVPAEPPGHRPVLTAGGEIPPAAWVWLVHVPEALRTRLTMPQLVSELLLRLCEVTGAAGGSVWLDRGDAAGAERLAEHAGTVDGGSTGAQGPIGREVVVPLPVARPLSGTLRLRPAPGSEPGPYWPELAALSAQRMSMGIDTDRLHAEDLRRRGWVTFLAEASELLANSLDVDLTRALVPQIVVPRLGRWCAVHTLEGHPLSVEELRLAAVTHADERQVGALRRALGGPPEPAEAPPDDGARDAADGAADGPLARMAEAAREHATMALSGELEGVVVPLSARGRSLGTLAVGRHTDRLHGAEDIAVIEDIARRASVAIDNAQEHAERTRIARDLQRALLPAELPVDPHLQFGAEYVPAGAGTDVGGDFYDVVALSRGRWLVSIGDVCGKGTQAAVVTGVVRDVVRTLVGESRSLQRILASLNRTVLATSDRYCTVATALVTPRSAAGGERTLDVTLCLAGHDRPILLHADGSTQPVGEWGSAVGLMEEFEVTEVRLSLLPGESLVFFTDGVTERRESLQEGAAMYETDRLRRVVRSLVGVPAATVATRVREDVVAFSADPPLDDIAVLVLRNPD